MSISHCFIAINLSSVVIFFLNVIYLEYDFCIIYDNKRVKDTKNRENLIKKKLTYFGIIKVLGSTFYRLLEIYKFGETLFFVLSYANKSKYDCITIIILKFVIVANSSMSDTHKFHKIEPT